MSALAKAAHPAACLPSQSVIPLLRRRLSATNTKSGDGASDVVVLTVSGQQHQSAGQGSMTNPESSRDLGQGFVGLIDPEAPVDGTLCKF